MPSGEWPRHYTHCIEQDSPPTLRGVLHATGCMHHANAMWNGQFTPVGEGPWGTYPHAIGLLASSAGCYVVHTNPTVKISPPLKSPNQMSALRVDSSLSWMWGTMGEAPLPWTIDTQVQDMVGNSPLGDQFKR